MSDIKFIEISQEDHYIDAQLEKSEHKVAITVDDCNNNEVPQFNTDYEDAKANNTSIASECDPTPNDSNDMKDTKIDIILTKDLCFRQQLIRYLRYPTTKTAWSSFEDYVGNMKHGQRDIYFMIGRSVRELIASPFVQRVAQAGFEVILMADPILDDRVLKQLSRRYEQYRLVAVNSDRLVLPRVESIQKKRKRQAEALKDFLPLCKRFKAIFSDDIQKVVISDTLVKQPLVVVPSDGNNDENGVPCHEINMETGRFRLEINPDNHSLRSLCARAALLDKKQEELNSLISFLVGGSLTTLSELPVQDSSTFESDTFYSNSDN